MTLLACYPDWYKGRRFLKRPPPIERPVDFLAWVASTTSTTTRDGVQTKLLGDVRQEDGLGTGMIPLDNIVGRPTMARGISDFVDTVNLRRENGGRALIRFKTFEMDRKAYQGEACDEIILDEDPGDDVIWGECQARLTATRGRILWSATSTLGLTPIRKRFKEHLPGTAEVLMTIDDCVVSRGGHIPDEDLPEIKARYKQSERATRLYGADMAGEGTGVRNPGGCDQIFAGPDYVSRLVALAVGRRFQPRRHVGAGASIRSRAGTGPAMPIASMSATPSGCGRRCRSCTSLP